MSKIIDELLDNDTKFREANLSLDDIKIAATFVSSALNVGWPAQDIIPFVTDLGITGIGWLDEEDVRFLITLAKAMRANGLKPEEFIREARNTKSAVNLYMNFKLGNIPAAEMAQRLGVRH